MPESAKLWPSCDRAAGRASVFAITLQRDRPRYTAGMPQADAPYDVLPDLPFAHAAGIDLALDLYLPRGVERPPLVVFIHGGGWRTHARKRFKMQWMAEAGFAVAVISYRLSSESTFPAQIHDCKGAVRWLRAHADAYGYDATRVAAAGSSAGGYLALLLGFTAGHAELEGAVGGHAGQSSAVQAVVDYMGPADFLHRAQTQPASTDDPAGTVYQLLGGPVASLRELATLASPITHLHDDAPPLLIFHGEADTVVLPDQPRRLHDACRARGLDSTLVFHPDAGHDTTLFSVDPYRTQAVDFLRRHLQ